MVQNHQLRRLLKLVVAACLMTALMPEWSPCQRPGKEADRRCQNCHGQEHIATISMSERETMVVAPESGLTERENPEDLFIDEEQLSRSAHYELTCRECHPGVEKLPHTAHLPGPLCSTCHEEEARAVSRSRHAEVLQRTEPPAPECWDCHGSHEILPQAEVNPLDKIRICASCHQTHSGQIEGVENGELLVQSYMDSVHGQDTGEPGAPSVGATCEDCHSHHAVMPIDDPRSRVHPRNIPETCGECHPDIYKEFEETVHADIAHRNDPSAQPALCTNCHTAHSITHAGTPSFTRDLAAECGSCHEDLYRTYRDTYHGQVLSLGGTRAARCSDCHGTHNIRRPEDPTSTLSAANRPGTCARCHEGINSLSEAGRRNFIAYRLHVDLRDRTENRALFLIWRLTIVLSVALLILWGLHWVGWIQKSFREKPALTEEGKSAAILRFRPLHRWIHHAVMCCVFGLILTGLPLKLGHHPAIADLTKFLVKTETLGVAHRLFAVFLALTALFYLFYLLFARLRRKRTGEGQAGGLRGLLPEMNDARQFREIFRWFLNKAEHPKLDYWSYREKFDWWAAAIVLSVLAASGIILWFPAFFAEFLSGYWFNAAMIVHGYAGLLAMGLILLIHILNTSLRREGFPFNTAIFSGQIYEDELKIWRPALYERLTETGALDRLREPAVAGSKLRAARYAAVTSQLLGIGLILLIVIAIMN